MDFVTSLFDIFGINFENIKTLGDLFEVTIRCIVGCFCVSLTMQAFFGSANTLIKQQKLI